MKTGKKSAYNLLNDKYRLLALKSLKEKAKTGRTTINRRTITQYRGLLTQATGTGTGHRGKALSDKAARAIAMAIRQMLNS